MPSASSKTSPTSFSSFPFTINGLLTCLAIISMLKLTRGAEEAFQYHGSGCPATWYRSYPMCGSDDINTMKTLRQSPIDIDSSQIKSHTTGMAPLLVRNYHLRAGRWRLEKARGTVLLKVDGISPFIEIPATYMFLQAHLHWGNGVAAKVGSEHSVDGQFYPLEVHLVHYNRARDEYAVVAILYEIAALNTQGADNERLRSIFEILETDALQQGYNLTGGNAILSFRSAFTLDNLLPQNWESYYRYNGSLTTPPCSENVIWTVLKDRSHISKRQLALLSDLKQCDAMTKVCYPRELIAPNLRPTQRLNDRSIYQYASGSTSIINFSLPTVPLILTLCFTVLSSYRMNA